MNWISGPGPQFGAMVMYGPVGVGEGGGGGVLLGVLVGTGVSVGEGVAVGGVPTTMVRS